MAVEPALVVPERAVPSRRAEEPDDKGAQPVTDVGIAVPAPVEDDRRGLAGQVIFGRAPEATAGVAGPAGISEDDGALLLDPDGRGIAGQEIFGRHDIEPLVEPAPEAAAPAAGSDDVHDDGALSALVAEDIVVAATLTLCPAQGGTAT